MCHNCSPVIGVLTIDQGFALSIIRSYWSGVCVYDTNIEATVLAVGHRDSEYHFSLLGPDGSRQVVTDPLNQSHWLESIHNGSLPLLWSERVVGIR